MSGPQSEKPRVPVLRESETALDSLRIKTLAAAPPPPPSEPNDWQRILGAVLRHKWLVLGITVLGTVVGVIATRFLDPRYTAKTILWVDVDVGRDRGIASPDEFMGTKGWVELVTSNIVLDTVVQQRRLFVTPIEPGDSTAVSGLDVTDRVIPGAYRLIVDKDGGTLRTIREACDYMASIGKQRELRPQWQQACKLILAKADVMTVSRALELALFLNVKA